MHVRNLSLALTLSTALFGSVPRGHAQTPALKPAPLAATAATAVPTLIPHTGLAVSGNGKALTGEAAATFLIFKEEQGGEPLFTESQTVAVDSTGHYTVNLGASLPNGLPNDLFATGEARWLEVQIAGEPSQPRVLLASVPYALKAADAATLGGLPASAFALAGSKTAAVAAAVPATITPDGTSNVTTAGGTSGYLPVFTGTSSVGNSILYSSSTGIGVGDVPNSSAVFDVNGKSIWRGLLNVSRAGTATTSTGYASFPMFFQASAWNTASKAALFPAFQLQAEPTGNNTATTGGTFNLLYAANSGTPAETGLYFNGNGTIHFASGQTFPGTGAGTITGVTAGTGLTGGGTSGKVTLNLNTGTIPTLAGNNSFTGPDTFKVSLYEDLDVNIDNTNANSGGISPGLRLGSASGEGMASKRTAGGNQYGVDLYTGYSPRLSINASGQVAIGTGAAFPAVAQLQVQSASGDGGDFTAGISPDGIGGFGLNATGGSVDNSHAAGAGGVFTGGSGADGGNGIFGEGGNGSAGNGGGDAGNGVEGVGGDGDVEGGYGGYFEGGNSNTATGYAGDGIFAQYGSASRAYGYSGLFVGNVQVTGTISADEKDFKIDHPADPANKYLVHASIESSELVNIYSGNVTTDEFGLATVQLPDWFEVENSDFRYQLTVVDGRFAQAVVSKKIENHQFTIHTNASHVEVSWQITGVRQDAYAKAHPLVVEQAKPANERGFYMHPELYGQPGEKQTEWGRHPKMMRHLKAMQEARKSRASLAVASQVNALPAQH